MISTICYLGNITSIHVRRWVEAFSSRGCDVHVISLASGGVDLPGSTVHLVKPPLHSRHLSYVLAQQEVGRLLENIQPDVLHAHWIPTYGLLGSLTGFLPLVVSAWGGDVMRAPFVGQNRSMKGRLTAPYYWLVDKYVLSRSSAVTTTSFAMRRVIADAFGVAEDRIATFPWGVDPQVFLTTSSELKAAWSHRLNLVAGIPVVLYNREVRPGYRTETLVRALPLLLTAVPNVVVIMLGGYADSTYLTRMMMLGEELGVREHIRLIDEEVSLSDVAALLSMSDAFVSIPLRDNRSSAVLEGMLCGVIPIVSAIPANHELVENGKNGFVVSGENPEELAMVLQGVLLDKENLKSSMGVANRQYVLENASWSVSVDKMERLYRLVSSRVGA